MLATYAGQDKYRVLQMASHCPNFPCCNVQQLAINNLNIFGLRQVLAGVIVDTLPRNHWRNETHIHNGANQ